MSLRRDRSAIAILGAGMGGLAAAAALHARGHSVRIYEQAKHFARIGAGIQMSPNAMRVLRGLGLEDRIRRTAFRPRSWQNREWDTGAMKFELPLGDVSEAKYGAPYLLMHRGDLHAALASQVPDDIVALGKRLVGLDQRTDGVRLRFEDGTTAEANALIAADGVHSPVRSILFGGERLTFSGRVAYRTVFPTSRLEGALIADYTKWWGPDRHIVTYYVTSERSEIYFVTSVPEPEWKVESWSAKGDLGDLQAAFEGFHEEVGRVLRAPESVHKWAIIEREPMPSWTSGRVVLLGDACHPMTPYMAQGAASAMEDGVVLARCIEAAVGDIPAAFARYEALRKPRTSELQLTSHRNIWMRRATNPDWVYGYDAWGGDLQPAA